MVYNQLESSYGICYSKFQTIEMKTNDPYIFSDAFNMLVGTILRIMKT